MPMNDAPRLLKPMVLQTKEELLTALKQGQLKTSKYNLLSDVEKLFVELVCFGGYTGEAAMRVIDPSIRNPLAAANRLTANHDVSDTIQELTVAKDKKFQAELQSCREMAMQKIMYIMNTTDDDTLAVTCAKVIMDKAAEALKSNQQKEEQVGAVKFNIQVENVYVPGQKSFNNDPVIIELTPDEIDPAVNKLQEENENLHTQLTELRKKKTRSIRPDTNQQTGLPFTLVYEGIDNYHDKTEEPAAEPIRDDSFDDADPDLVADLEGV